jgi:hypothetical protein
LLELELGLIHGQEQLLQFPLPALNAIVLALLGHRLNHQAQASTQLLEWLQGLLQFEANPRPFLLILLAVLLELETSCFQQALGPRKLLLSTVPLGVIGEICWG